MKKEQKILILSLLLVCLLGVGILGWTIYQHHGQQKIANESKIEQQRTKTSYNKAKAKREEENKAMAEEINNALQTKSVTAGVSVYEISEHNRFSINGNIAFKAGSTLRLPLAMMIADQINIGKTKLSETIPYQSEYATESKNSVIAKQPKHSYTIESLLRLMIVSNDEVATNMLENYVGGQTALLTYIKDVYNKKQSTKKAVMTPDDAILYLRLLYDNKSSNPVYDKIQNWMTNSDKEGLSTDKTSKDIAHLYYRSDDYYHDIGIYYGKNPYLIAIYTKGDTDTEEVVSQISDIINKYLD